MNLHDELIKSLEQAISQAREIQKREANFWEYGAEYYLKDDRDETPMKILTMSSEFIDLRGTRDIKRCMCGSIDAVKDEVVKIYK